MGTRVWVQGPGSLRAFTLFEGVLMLVLGVLALLFPLVASRWVTAVVALGLIVGGLIGWIVNVMRAPVLGRWLVFWRLVVASLFLLVGGSIIRDLGGGPLASAEPVASLTLALGILFVLEGLVAAVVALGHRQIRGWTWGLANGLVTLLLGGLILSMSTTALLAVLGLLVGVSFLFSAVDLLVFSARFHSDP